MSGVLKIKTKTTGLTEIINFENRFSYFSQKKSNKIRRKAVSYFAKKIKEFDSKTIHTIDEEVLVDYNPKDNSLEVKFSYEDPDLEALHREMSEIYNRLVESAQRIKSEIYKIRKELEAKEDSFEATKKTLKYLQKRFLALGSSSNRTIQGLLKNYKVRLDTIERQLKTPEEILSKLGKISIQLQENVEFLENKIINNEPIPVKSGDFIFFRKLNIKTILENPNIPLNVRNKFLIFHIIRLYTEEVFMENTHEIILSSYGIKKKK